MPEGHDTTIEVSNILSFMLYTQILKQSVLKPASPGITLNKVRKGGPSRHVGSLLWRRRSAKFAVKEVMIGIFATSLTGISAFECTSYNGISSI